MIPDSLAARILATLSHGPSTVGEVRLELDANPKAVSRALKRMVDRSQAVRLYLQDGPRKGGPRPWVYGLAGTDYGPGASLESKILRALAERRMTTAGLAAMLPGYPARSVSAGISEMRLEGKVRRYARQAWSSPTEQSVWIYELGNEADRPSPPPSSVEKPKAKRIPHPERIAGRVYARQYKWDYSPW